MSTWSEAELSTIGRTDELQISSVRTDGTTTKPVTIWTVRVEGDVFVRSVRGRGGGWFKATQATGRGNIGIGAVERDVMYREVNDTQLNAKISSAYRTKYARYAASIVDSTLTADAVEATVQLTPL